MTDYKTRMKSVALLLVLSAYGCGEEADSNSNDQASTAGTGTMTPTGAASTTPMQTTQPAASTQSTQTEPAATTTADTTEPTMETTPTETTDTAPAEAPVPPDATGAVFSDDFEGGGANWDVIQGSCLPAQDATMVMTCTNGGNEARAVAGDPTWTDFTVAANVMIRQIDDGKRIYLAGRFTDADNWYGAAFYNSGTRKIQLRKKVEGSSDDIAATNFEWEDNKWYTVQLSMSGTTLSMSVDGTPLLEATDEDFAAGSIALLVDSSEVSWDNVVVTTP
jgi:hypothetical protein